MASIALFVPAQVSGNSSRDSACEIRKYLINTDEKKLGTLAQPHSYSSIAKYEIASGVSCRIGNC